MSTETTNSEWVNGEDGPDGLVLHGKPTFVIIDGDRTWLVGAIGALPHDKPSSWPSVSAEELAAIFAAGKEELYGPSGDVLEKP